MAQTQSPNLQAIVGKLAKAHYAYVAIFVASIIAQDAWKLINPEAVLGRWTVAAIMLSVTTALWYTDWTFNLRPRYTWMLVMGFVSLDIFVATYLVYAERGMASRGVALYAIPIAVAALTKSRNAIYGVASICVAAYSLAAVRYFVVYFNEGYKIELYSTVAFYSAMMFVLAAILSLVVRNQK